MVNCPESRSMKAAPYSAVDRFIGWRIHIADEADSRRISYVAGEAGSHGTGRVKN